jgi:hypothetical protein
MDRVSSPSSTWGPSANAPVAPQPKAYCANVSSCNLYVIQLDRQYSLINFIHNTYWLNMFRTSTVHLQERFSSSCKLQIWYVVFCVRKIQHTKFATYSLRKNAPEDGLLRSETC